MIQAGIIGTLNGLETTIKSISSLSEYILTGYYTDDQELHKKDRNLLKLKRYFKPYELINRSDAIIIADQPGEYEDLISEILKNSKHILIFTDKSLSISQINSFIKLAEEAGVFMFFHHDKYDHQWQDIILKHFGKPEYIDDYICLDQSSQNCKENVYNAFYSELFIVMRINPVNPRKFFTTTIPFYSADPHFLNARIEFENGTSANVTINKYTDGNKSRLDIFRHDMKATIDPETSEIKISRDNSEIMYSPGKKIIDTRKAGLSLFLKYLLSGNYTSDLFETGIAAHRAAIEIINQLLPVPENSINY